MKVDYGIRGIPTKSFVHSGGSYSGVKVLKERITVLFYCQCSGRKDEVASYMQKSQSKIIQKSSKKQHLLVVYKANSKAWMTSIIFCWVSPLTQ